MIKNYKLFLFENVTLSLDMVINIIRSLKGDENKELVNKLVNYSDKKGKNVLMTVVQSNNLELIDFILGFDVDLQHKDNNNQNVLFYCKNISIFKKFYNLGVDIKLTSKIQMKNILCHLAAKNLFNFELYDRLVRDGIDINQLDKYNNNAFSYSILNKRIVELFIKNGADINNPEIHVQENYFYNLTYKFTYYKNKRNIIIEIFKILFRNGLKILDLDKFCNLVQHMNFYDKCDIITDFLEPLKEYITEEMVFKLFNSHSNAFNNAPFAKQLLNLGIYPEFYKYLKKYYSDTFEEKFADYIKEHPFLDDSNKYNL